MRFIFSVLVFLLFSAALAACGASQGSFVLINKASEKISRAQVLICGQEIELHEIDAGARSHGTYKVSRDSHYEIKIQFASGREIVNEVGYVTPGVNFYHEITVEDSNVWISRSDIK